MRSGQSALVNTHPAHSARLGTTLCGSGEAIIHMTSATRATVHCHLPGIKAKPRIKRHPSLVASGSDREHNPIILKANPKLVFLAVGPSNQ